MGTNPRRSPVELYLQAIGVDRTRNELSRRFWRYVNPDPGVDVTKHAQTTFYDILDTMFWRHSAKMDRKQFLKKRDLLPIGGYVSEDFYGKNTFPVKFMNENALSVENFNLVYLKYWNNYERVERPKDDRASTKQQGRFRAQVLPMTRAENGRDFPDYDDWYVMDEISEPYLVEFGSTEFEDAFMQQSKKYVMVKSLLNPLNYSFFYDISDRLLSGDFLTPYFTSVKHYRYKYFGEPFKRSRDDVIWFFIFNRKQVYFDAPFEKKHYFYNKDFSYYDNLLQIWNIPRDIERDSALLGKRWKGLNVFHDAEFFAKFVDLGQKNNSHSPCIDHFFNSFYTFKTRQLYSFKARLIAPTLNINHWPSYGYSELFTNLFTTLDPEHLFFDFPLYSHKGCHLTSELSFKDFTDALDIRPHPDRAISRTLLKDTPIGLDLPWFNFWFPGNLYNPFHDYDSTSYAFKVRKVKDSLNLSHWDAPNSLLVFLDPQFARPLSIVSFATFNGLQIAFFFSAAIGILCYLFVLLRLHFLLSWIMRYINESDFWHLRVLFNINFYPIFRGIMRVTTAIFYYSFILSLLVLLWKSSFFLTFRYPYWWDYWFPKTPLSRYHEPSPLQMPIFSRRVFRHRQSRSIHRYWWRIFRKEAPKPKNFWNPEKRWQMRYTERTKFRRSFLRKFTFYEYPSKFNSDLGNHIENTFYWGINHDVNYKRINYRRNSPYSDFDPPYPIDTFNAEYLHNASKLVFGYKHRRRNRKFKLPLSKHFRNRMYGVFNFKQIGFLNPLNDFHHMRYPQHFSKVWVRNHDTNFDGISSVFSPFTRIDRYSTVNKSFHLLPFSKRNKVGRKWYGRNMIRRGRPFSNTQFFQGGHVLPDKLYWGTGYLLSPLAIFKTLSEFFYLKFMVLLDYFIYAPFPYRTRFNTSAYVRPHTLKNRWMPGDVSCQPLSPVGDKKFIDYLRRLRKVKEGSLKPNKFFKRPKDHNPKKPGIPPIYDLLKVLFPVLKRPVVFFRTQRPLYFVFSSTSYYLRYPFELFLAIFRVLYQEALHITIIILFALYAFFKYPLMQPLHTLKDYAEAHYHMWTVIDERAFRKKIKRVEVVPRPLRIKKFHYEFWSSTPRSTWCSSSCS